MSLRKIINRDLHFIELFRGSSIALVFKFFSIAAGYFFFYVLALYFKAEGVGIFSACWTLLMISAVLGKLGFDTSIVKFVAGSIAREDHQYAHKVYWRSLIVVFISSSLVALLVCLASPLLSTLFFDNSTDSSIIQLIGITVVPLSLLHYNAESLKGLKKITAYSIFQNGTIYFLTMLTILIMSIYSKNKYLTIVALSISVFLLMIMSFTLTIKYFKIRKYSNTALPRKKLNTKQIIFISLPMLLSNSLFLLMSWMDTLMLSAFKDEHSVGIYNTSLKIAALVTIALVAINSIAAPKYAELFEKGNHKGFKRFVGQTSFINFLVSFPAFVIILLLPEFLLSIFGEEFIEGKIALIILAFGNFFSAFSGSTMHILNMTGKERVAKNILITSTILNIILNFVLIPPYGIIGAAAATTFSTICWNVMATFYIYRYHNFFTYPILPIKQFLQLNYRLHQK